MLQGQEHQEHCSGEQRCLPESSPLSLPERDTQAQGAVGAEVSHTTQLFKTSNQPNQLLRDFGNFWEMHSRLLISLMGHHNYTELKLKCLLSYNFWFVKQLYHVSPQI